jgi:hypothetical protein
MEFFQKLGTTIEIRWRQKNYDEASFPSIASQALTEMDPRNGPNPTEIICKLHENLEMPLQLDDKFSDLAVTLYKGPRFHISAYYWLNGTTSIHQHGFSGAFQVLLGSSIHTRYSFNERRVINEHMSTGQIVFESIELLGLGEIRQIIPGRTFIHSLFHLDRPSVTITVRTNRNRLALPQYDYLIPYLAVDPVFEDRAMRRQVQSISLLMRMGHPEVDSFVGQLVKAVDFQTMFEILTVYFKFIIDTRMDRIFQVENGEERFGRIIELARQKHGDLVDLLPPVFEELQRNLSIIDQRRYVTSPEHRFFLALVLNVHDKERIIQLVSQRYPADEPVDKICQWLEQLSAVQIPNSRGPNIVGIDGFDDLYLAVFRRMLQGWSPGETEIEFEREQRLVQANDRWGGVERMCDALKKTILLKAMLREPAAGFAAHL